MTHIIALFPQEVNGSVTYGFNQIHIYGVVRRYPNKNAQLLWFWTNAELRAITLWQSLRLHYSPFEIIRYRLTYLLVMRLPPVRWLFHLFMARTGRGYFDERVDL